MQNHIDVAVLEGNGASPAVLRQAKIHEANILIAVSSKDEVNLVCCAAARGFEGLVKIARVSNPDFYRGEGLILAAQGYDLVTAVSAALAAMSSIGPGLEEVGPTGHYGGLNTVAHLTLSGLMLLGRLEFYTVIVLFIPATWPKWGGER